MIAAKGYPGTPDKGGAISGLAQPGATVFHAGTALKDGKLVANGGRVLGVTARWRNSRRGAGAPPIAQSMASTSPTAFAAAISAGAKSRG